MTIVISLSVTLGAIFLVFAYANLTTDLPSLDALPSLLDSQTGLLLEPTRIYDRSGQHLLATIGGQAGIKRKFLPLPAQARHDQYIPDSLAQEVLSNNLISVTLSVSDPGYWKRPILSLDESSSKLTQKLVADLLFWNEPAGLRRTIRIKLVAFQVTMRYGRDQVLEWYLNSAYYGRQAYGAEAAAQLYFGCSASELSLAQATVLAVVAEAPALNPLDAPQAALERQRKLIQTMVKQGMIGLEKASEAANEKIVFEQDPRLQRNQENDFVEFALGQLSRQIQADRVARGGLRVISTLDYDFQQEAVCAVSTQLERMGAKSQVAPQTLSACNAARLLPALATGSRNIPADLSANVLVLDPQTGQVLAWVDETKDAFSAASTPGQPAGTLIMPFVYLTAFTRGYSPASLLWDLPDNELEAQGLIFSEKYYGPERLRTALVNDTLSPVPSLINQIGIENIWQMLQQLGLSAEDSSLENMDFKTLLEENRLTLLEASRAYGILANQGKLVGWPRNTSEGRNGQGASSLGPVTVLRVEDLAGAVWFDGSIVQTRPLISSQLAYLLTNVLSDETARWPSMGHPNPLEIGRSVGAKIGRDGSGKSAWTVGYTQQYVVGVWMGGEQNAALKKADSTLSTATAGLWHAVIQYASQNQSDTGWSIPPGVSIIDVCDPSGLLPTADCPAVVSEYFLTGNEPTQTDTLFRRIRINRETGLLATVFTPSELVQEQVFLTVPPEAQAWAQQAGVPLPPDTYDVVRAPEASPEVQISAPSMFAYVRGKVAIQGSAAGDDFSSYRIQVGQGLDPQEWLQVGQDITTPVDNGELSTWDTGDLNGLYAVQLQVVREDRRMDSAIIQVTVDNQPPSLLVRYPVEGQEVALSGAGMVTFQLDLQDNVGIQVAEIYVDDALVGKLTQTPFAFPWKGKSGAHVLHVVAYDRAGNSSQADIHFSVK